VKNFLLKLFSRRKKPLVIIIRGAPSTGKTTTAHEIRKRLPDSFILSFDSLVAMNVPEELVGEERIGTWGKMRPLGHELGYILTSYLLKRGKNVIIEEMLPDATEIRKIVRLTNSCGAKPFVFELTAPREVIKRREKIRRDLNPEKPVEMIIDLLTNNPYPEATKIDTSKKSAEKCADFILSYIRRSSSEMDGERKDYPLE